MNSSEGVSPPLLFIAGASGYIGGRLLSRLEQDGARVRCLARHPESLESRVGPNTSIVRGDVLDRSWLESALVEVDVAYYLVHSMASSGDFVERDRLAARNFALAARATGVDRIVYLGRRGRSGRSRGRGRGGRRVAGHRLCRFDAVRRRDQ
ncbi:MAG: NAD(P)H-binding protein [Acidobacteriota bacterium]|nr:NAD(P)H-binding protein [Acidobacteriota bacterium]